LKNERVDVITQIISTDVLIKKVINTNQTMAGMSLHLCDETGIMNAIFYNEKIKLVKIGETIMIRGARIEIINGFVSLILDENSNIFVSEELSVGKRDKNMCVDINYSNIKLNLINTDII